MSDRSMLAWLKPASLQDVAGKLGLAVVILGALIKNAVEHMTWGAQTQAIVCGLFTLVLALTAAAAPRTAAAGRFRWTVGLVAAAYAWMTLLYLMGMVKEFAQPAGYDAATDMAGTLVFIGAWFCLPSPADDEAGQADRMLMIVAALAIFISGGIKVGLQAKGMTTGDEYQAARLMLNMCNGVAMLGLYGAIRRTQRPPDPVTHALIVFFGCAQVAARGRDCLGLTDACVVGSISGLTAYAIAWILLLGKIALAAYIAYCYFNPPDETDEVRTGAPADAQAAD